jgi:hypothetical protein
MTNDNGNDPIKEAFAKKGINSQEVMEWCEALAQSATEHMVEEGVPHAVKLQQSVDSIVHQYFNDQPLLDCVVIIASIVGQLSDICNASFDGTPSEDRRIGFLNGISMLADNIRKHNVNASQAVRQHAAEAMKKAKH